MTWPTRAVIALGKNALIVKRRSCGARPRSTIVGERGGRAAVTRAWAAMRLSSRAPAARFCAFVGTRVLELTTRTRPVIPGWTEQKYVNVPVFVKRRL